MNWKKKFDEKFSSLSLKVGTDSNNERFLIGTANEIKKFIGDLIGKVIDDLEENPNLDGSQSPNIPHWIEAKKKQLRDKYLKE